jgi:hypothetical protein
VEVFTEGRGGRGVFNSKVTKETKRAEEFLTADEMGWRGF